MGYWSEVKNVIAKGVDLAMEGIKESAERAAEMGKEGLEYARLRKDLFLEREKLKELLADLGDRTRDLYKEKKDIYADGKVKEIMERVVASENACRGLDEKLKQTGSRK